MKKETVSTKLFFLKCSIPKEKKETEKKNKSPTTTVRDINAKDRKETKKLKMQRQSIKRFFSVLFRCDVNKQLPTCTQCSIKVTMIWKRIMEV